MAVVAVLLMAKKKLADGTDQPKKRDTRTIRLPKDIGRMMKRTAVLRDCKNLGAYADPTLGAFLDKITKGGIDAAPRKVAEVPDDQITTINAGPAIANRITRVAGLNLTGVQHLLNDPLLRDAVTADYLSALKNALGEWGLQAVPIEQSPASRSPA